MSTHGVFVVVLLAYGFLLAALIVDVVRGWWRDR